LAIGSTQSQLYFLPGITALILSLKQQLTRTRILVIMGILLISALTKETGFLFFLLVPIYRYLLRLGSIKIFIGLEFLLVLIYSYFRISVAGVTYNIILDTPIASLSFLQRLVNVPAIFIDLFLSARLRYNATVGH
jgi:hypothetical protein